MPRRPSALCKDAMPASLKNEKIVIDEISCVVNQLIYKHWFHHPSGEWIRQPNHILTWINHPQDLIDEVKCSPVYWTKFQGKMKDEKQITINVYVDKQYIIKYDIERIDSVETTEYKVYQDKLEELS